MCFFAPSRRLPHYLLIVDNERVNGKVKQRVLLRLGRLDQLQASGQIDALIESLGRFSEKLAILGAHARAKVSSRTAFASAPVCSSSGFGRTVRFTAYWCRCSKGGASSFLSERAIFLTVLHRLLARQRTVRREVEGRLRYQPVVKVLIPARGDSDYFHSDNP